MTKETKEYERYSVNITQNAEDDLNEIIMYCILQKTTRKTH
jgi:hypothetical protein